MEDLDPLDDCTASVGSAGHFRDFTEEMNSRGLPPDHDAEVDAEDDDDGGGEDEEVEEETPPDPDGDGDELPPPTLESVLQCYELAKSLVICSPIINRNSRTSSGSPVWSWYNHDWERPKHTGNFATHLRTHQLSAKKRRPSDNASEAPSSAKKAKKGVGAAAFVPVSSIQVPTIQASPSHSTLTSQPLAFDRHVRLGRTSALQKFHDLTFQFANNNNLAVRSVTSAECPEFRELINYVLCNAKLSSLLTGDDCLWVSRSSQQRALRSMSDSLVHPTRRKWFKIPIALMHITDKKAIPTVDDIMGVMARVGVKKDDFFKAVNDTTNVAVKVGRLLADEDGTCHMHQVDLVMEHATGIGYTEEGQGSGGRLSECELVRTTCHKSASYIMEKKSKK
eukprot:IDg2138t1